MLFVSKLIYNFLIRVLYCVIYIVSFFNYKAKQWIIGRRHNWHRLKKVDFSNQQIIWFHCASLGEFEQGLPVMQALKKEHQYYKIFVTFFSPSGFNKIYNNNSLNHIVDYVFYLPLDTKKNCKKIIQIVQPKIVFIVKYEYWFNFLKTLKTHHISVIIFSTIFLKTQVFFKWYGFLHRYMLSLFSVIYVQTLSSKKLLSTIKNIKKCEVVGDTRFDRVLNNLQLISDFKLEWFNHFKNNHDVLVVGSSWQDDVNLIIKAYEKIKTFNIKLKLIIVPHEIKAKQIDELKHIFSNSFCISQYHEEADFSKYEVAIIDCIGLLSRLYFYADYVYVGGGFNKSGIHNILEPAVFGKYIFIGKNYTKFNEAIELIKLKGIKSVSTWQEFVNAFLEIQHNPLVKKETEKINSAFVQINSGVSEKIINSLYEKRLLIKIKNS